MFCPFCGTQVSDNDKECPNCHESLEMLNQATLFCSYCGQRISKSTETCPYCGAIYKKPRKPYPKNSVGVEIKSEKNEGLAIILSMFVTGLGTIYAGYDKEGLILILAMIACLILGFFFIFPWIINVVLWVYGLYDAFKKCKDSNELWYEYRDSQR